MGVELATFESPYKRRTLGADTIDRVALMRAPLDLYIRQAAATIKERDEQIIYALEQMEKTANVETLLSSEFRSYIYSLGAKSANGYDIWKARREERLKAAEQSRAAQAQAAALAASGQARAYAEAMRKKAEAAEAARDNAAQAAAQAASEQAKAYAEAVEQAAAVATNSVAEESEAAAASAIVDAEAAAAVDNLEKTIEAAHAGSASAEQVELAAAVAADSLDKKAKKDAVSKIVPLTIAAGLCILILRRFK